LIIGFIPLLSFISISENKYLFSVILTAVALVFVGWLKGFMTEKNKLYSSLQALIIGGAAATIAFLVGYFLKSLIG